METPERAKRPAARPTTRQKAAEGAPWTSLAILADDFTGSNDTGVQFAKRGLPTGVLLDPAQLAAMMSRFAVLAVDTESRFAAPQSAYQAVRKAVLPLVRNGVASLYKKIDSTVRGNLGAEICAVLDGAGLTGALVCPALPAYKRTVEQGNCLVDGVPIAETEFGRDPRTPVRTSRIAQIIREQCSYAVSEIDLKLVRRGPRALAAAIDAVWSESRPGIVVVDAVRDADLATIAQSAGLTAAPPLLVGSSGLAAHLPLPDAAAADTKVPALAASADRSPADTQSPRPPCATILIAIGSASATVAEQIDRACAARPQLREIVVNPRHALSNEPDEQARITERYLAAVHAGHSCLVRTERPAVGSAPAADTAEALARFMGELVCRLWSAAAPAALVLSGGDTAVKTAVSLGCAGFSIEAEVLPGIPLGRFISAASEDRRGDRAARPPAAALERMRVVTKAGAFGPPDALLAILQYLEEHRP